ncbi:MAG: bifunctional (p)ppGpp synthetase/guanosine-3',5'-bis(diphosphate) 3'-pyrophosphohydrolase [Bacteroides sp.]|nr:bifunctional (p)ppGpp synthetase/guanosine-3',5'-bis(diphosphate) 3'-pyrophosphohydrolase [Bacteroides sp.]MBD5319866.1 bifunctional (p)ppGpp synthetase/guanosine-3',5'-bis(diphosphate) 3'-pyrophosphohydrolase [Bacteroides sp.]MBD5349906.1 bifunctional (p)ppGpp synthetase/guanosine-3',5'-bis(diphosphate) 3'-pyrophosphohydrolase [Bacteroides sp.]
MSPEEEDRLIEAEFQDVLNGYLNSNHRKKVEIIERAFRFAKKAHGGIRRRSGEPYILHPIAVAKIASQEIGLGSTSICAAFLHDVVEDTDYTVEDIEQQFGPKIAELVSGLTKISGGIFGDKASLQAENFRKLLLTMSEDIRVVLIKIADRLHNMRTLGSMAPNKQYKIAGETLYIYAPLAYRLGLFNIKTELEDLSFKYEHPAAYKKVADQLAESEERRLAIYSDFSAPILERLNGMGIKYDAKARVKSVFSIWRKMETKQIPFEEVYDLYAVRIIFDCEDQADEKAIAWRIYSAITDLYRLHPERTRDWIVNPKANGYQALHLTVMGPDGNWVEVQIRSRRMDEIAEKGFAAHWKYKIGEGEEENELHAWLGTIKDILDDPNPNAVDFLDTLKLNLFAAEIVVFTPKGELITLPARSTVLDVAFTLHSEIGSKCIAGKVNHKLVPLSHRLNSGDQVEVLTSQSQKPKPEWESFLASAKARTRLRKALRAEIAPTIEEGRRKLNSFLEEAEVKATNEVITKMMAFYHCPSRDTFYYKLGTDEISLDGYVLKDSPKTSPGLLKKIFRIGAGKNKPEPQESGPRIIIPEKINMKEVYPLVYSPTEQNFVFAGCCSPVPGDDVMGFVNDNGEVEVHSLTCPHAQLLKAGYGPRILSTRWETVERTFPAEVNIDGVDRHGILQELTQLISTQLGIDIRALHIDTDHEVFNCRLKVMVADAGVIVELCDKIKKIDGVQSAMRVEIAGE